MGKLQSGTLFIVGVAVLITSIIYDSSILAFIGLGLVFWGAILLYIQPEEYTRKALLDAAVKSSLKQLNQIMQEVDYRGKAIYLPPKYFRNPDTSKIYLPKHENGKLPTPEHILKQENAIFIGSPEGLLLTPAGAELASLFERTLGTSFTRTDLRYLQQKLPRLFIEDLEIAENLEIEARDSKEGEMNDTIHVRITDSLFKDLYKAAENRSHIGVVGCPICSALACALTKATGKPITIEAIQPIEDGEIIEATYRVLETN